MRTLLGRPYYLLAFLFLLSCRQEVSQKELLLFVDDQENGVFKSKQSNNYLVQVKFIPYDLMMVNRINQGSKEPISEFEKYIYLKLIFIPLNSLSKPNSLSLLNFGMLDKVFVRVDGKKEYPLDFFHMNTYEMGLNNEIVYSFQKDKLLKQNTLTVSLQEFGLQTGNMNFIFNTEDVKSIPKLKIN